MRLVLAFAALPGIALSAACSVADVPSATATAPADLSTSTHPDATNDACSAQPAMSANEVAKLPKCTCASGGSARCVPTSKLPGSLADQLAPCDDTHGACVPDTVLARSAGPLPSCRSSGHDGRCLSLCVPTVAKYADSLTRGDGDACASDERCVPCVSPLDGTSTGVCDVGAACAARAASGSAGGAPPPPTTTGSKSGGSTVVAPPSPDPGTQDRTCCPIGGTMRGTCAASGGVDASRRAHLSQHDCAQGELCVPSEDASNGTICALGAGVCVSQCESFPFFMQLPPLGCRSDQQCVVVGAD